MATIRIEFVPIEKYNLGLLSLDHMQLVLEDETDFLNSQDYWKVMEGIHDGGIFNGTLGVLGEDGGLQLSTANDASRDALVAKIGTPESRGSRIIKTGPGAFEAWQDMAAYATEIQEQQLPYIGVSWPFGPTPTINSTSFITTLVWTLGYDINYLLPFGIRYSPGTGTIIGTTHSDDITARGNQQTIATGFGSDHLHGSNNFVFLDKLYGGDDNDTLYWSEGENIIHGGQPRLAYAEDGTDTIDYTGVGKAHIISNKHPVEHKVATYDSAFEGGNDQLFSIEQLAYDTKNDVITAGEGVDLLERPLEIDLKGQDGGGKGDKVGLTEGRASLIINAVDDEFISVQSVANSGQDAGYWIKSAEWLTGSSGDDFIYANASLLGAEGDEGNDVVDGRFASTFTGGSPQGYDIELDGGNGSDTLVSGAGRSIAHGGNGSDRFVLSTMSSGNGQVEFVIDDASSSDSLYVPYNYFKINRGDFDGSTLFQLTGAPFKIDNSIPKSYFDNGWDRTSTDEVHGNIEFVGLIYYEMEGSDLVITLMEGTADPVDIPGDRDTPPQHWLYNDADTTTETNIRVQNWHDGDLGISFPISFDFNTFANSGSLSEYPGRQSAVDSEASTSRFADPLDSRPDPYLPKEFQQAATSLAFARAAAFVANVPTSGDDVLTIPDNGPYRLDALGGNDDITGSDHADIIDGGSGADIMRGGKGNDTYYVDNPGDQVIELARGSFDDVYSTIDYVLPENVEHLTLVGVAAVHGTGNNQRNTVVGNAGGNVLEGRGGDDTLAGNEGNDRLIGGDGSDGYVYSHGDGRDVIVETAGQPGDEDVVVLTSDWKPEDVTFIRNPLSADNLILRFSDGGEITIENYFLGGGAGIERLEFVRGPTWDATEFAAKANAAIVTSNAAPVASDDSYIFAGHGGFTISAAAFTDNDYDPDGNPLTIVAVTNVNQGSVTIGANGDLVFAPDALGGNTLSFSYTVSDGHGGTASAAVDLTLVDNHAPAITGTAFAALDAATRSANGHIAAEDADGDHLLYRLASGGGPLKGTVTFGAGGDFTYHAFNGASGADTFTIEVTDSLSGAASHTFNTAIPDGPVAIEPPAPHPGTPAVSHIFIGTRHRDHLTGTDEADVFYGKKANDVLIGRGGDDVFMIRGNHDGLDRIDGGAGFDVLRGGKHNDTFRVANELSNLESIEAIEGKAGSGDRIVATAAGDSLDFSKLKITGIERIELGAGGDTVVGSHGNDRIAGGSGHDTFVFRHGGGHDTVLDFETGNGFNITGDKIDLRQAHIASYADLWGHISQSGNDALITIDAKNSILLKGVDIHVLQFADFEIV